MIQTCDLNTLRYNPDDCIGCGICLDVCPHAVFAQKNRLVEMVNGRACMECGACQLNCPSGAIVVDSGVGCAAAMMRAALLGKQEATCG